MIPTLATGQWALVFLVAAVVLVRAAVTLASAGDEIAERTGLGGVLAGTLLLAAATSLPEIATDVAAALADAPDLAVGDLFGSSMANMAILAVVDLAHRGRVWPSVELAQARVAAMAIALTALAALAIATPPGFRIGWVGVDTIAIAGLYLAAVRWFRRSPVRARLAPAGITRPVTDRPAPGPVRPSVVRFAVAAGAILLVAPALAVAAREMASQAGVAESTVGVGLLAVTTSLPELAVSLAALRIGAYDLAVGNLFGSNAANMSVLVLVDVAFTDGPLLAAVSPAQVTAAVAAILLMALAMAAIVSGNDTRIGRFEPDAVLLLLAYVGSLVAVGLAS